MTEPQLLILSFDNEFDEYEQNRMYPLGHRKEPPMTQLNVRHLNAVCHAEFYLNKATDQFLEPHMRAQQEDDMLRLAELKMHIINEIIQPPGLFDLKDKPNGHKSP